MLISNYSILYIRLNVNKWDVSFRIIMTLGFYNKILFFADLFNAINPGEKSIC